MNDLPAPPALRPLTVFLLIAFCLSLSSCQCSWKPDVGPVDDEEAYRGAPAPAVAAAVPVAEAARWSPATRS